MSLLEITDLTHSFAENRLFRNAAFTLHAGEHVGVVGPNGAGKSTLINICTGQMIPDSGRIIWQPGVKVGYLDQYARIDRDMTMEEFLKSAFADLYQLEEKLGGLYDKASDGDPGALELAAKYHEQLEQRGFYSIDTRIRQVASGLGLLSLGLGRPIRTLSGGQRAKVILAKLLLQNPDVLLLDEPTNFLDAEHIAWLAGYLAAFKNAFLVVSHDFAFLEKISTHICDIDNQKITKYHGAYSEFLKKKTFLQEDYIRQYNAQQKEIKKTEEFIRRNIAGRKTRMAKGRRKLLNRMERMEALQLNEAGPDFRFHTLPATSTDHLVVDHLSVGYRHPILSDLAFTIKGGQKIVITGFNGVGKSTLLKTLVTQIPALKGGFTFSRQVTIGYFEQDLVWEDDELTPIQIVADAWPSLEPRDVRQRLARCGISSKHAVQPVGTLSGGEQAKVKLCLLTMKPCNFLILDEPTNHLDRAAKESLQAALCEFPGTVLLVTHEEAFYRDWADGIINVENAVTHSKQISIKR